LPYQFKTGSNKEHILLESTLLFCMKGFTGVSMRDISQKIGITAAALYNHFSSKNDLWHAVLDHSLGLYLLYHRHLNDLLEQAHSFEDALDLMLREPMRMQNEFTCYAFSLIVTEQFRDARAGEIFTKTFNGYSIDFHKNWFDSFVRRGLARPFDTRLAAKLFVQCVLTHILLKVHSLVGNSAYDGEKSFRDFKSMVMSLAAL
jgi:AcrR family transcriptional regulator